MSIERPSHKGLRHLALNVQALDEMKRFYVDLLGFIVEWEPDPDNVYLSSGTDNLALHQAESPPGGLSGPQAAPGGQRLDHLGLIVGTPDEVDRWAAFLEARGVTLAARPRTHRDGARSCYFSDPDGNTIQMIYHAPISGSR
jgi:catechol 2,3-dioxygenase-like lactoylglutathione lyase family enzyme